MTCIKCKPKILIEKRLIWNLKLRYHAATIDSFMIKDSTQNVQYFSSFLYWKNLENHYSLEMSTFIETHVKYKTLCR